jgi:hypothetical protein
MNEQDFLKCLREHLMRGQDARGLKRRVMAKLLDMADEVQAVSQHRSLRQLLFLLRVRLLQLQAHLRGWLSEQWQWHTQAAKAQVMGAWQDVLYLWGWLRIDPVVETLRSRTYTAEHQASARELQEGFKWLRWALVRLEGLATIFALSATGASLLVQAGMAHRMPTIPVMHTGLRWLNNVSVWLADAAVFLGLMAVVVMLPHIARLIRVFWIVRPTLD